MDTSDPVTRSFALKLASKFPGKFNIDQACEIYTYIKSRWKYVSDPRDSEYFAKASETIAANFAGDCDDFAILIATCIESIDGKTRINFVYNPKDGGHAYAEVYAGRGEDVARNTAIVINRHFSRWYQKLLGISAVPTTSYHQEPSGDIWINLDWWSEYPGGPYFEDTNWVAYYPSEGRYEVRK